MSMEESIKVALNPNRAFKVYMCHKDRRITSHIILPKDGKFSLRGNGYVINPERIFFEKKMPCAIYSFSVAEPINPLDINEQSRLSSQDFYNAIESTVVQDIIRSTGKIDNTLLMAIVGMGVVSVIAVMMVAYYLQGTIAAQSQQILLLQQTIDALKSSGVVPGGGGW